MEGQRNKAGGNGPEYCRIEGRVCEIQIFGFRLLKDNQTYS